MNEPSPHHTFTTIQAPAKLRDCSSPARSRHGRRVTRLILLGPAMTGFEREFDNSREGL